MFMQEALQVGYIYVMIKPQVPRDWTEFILDHLEKKLKYYCIGKYLLKLDSFGDSG